MNQRDDESKIWPYSGPMRSFTKDNVHNLKPKVLRVLLLDAISALDGIETLLRKEFAAAAEKKDVTEQ